MVYSVHEVNILDRMKTYVKNMQNKKEQNKKHTSLLKLEDHPLFPNKELWSTIHPAATSTTTFLIYVSLHIIKQVHTNFSTMICNCFFEVQQESSMVP